MPDNRSHNSVSRFKLRLRNKLMIVGVLVSVVLELSLWALKRLSRASVVWFRNMMFHEDWSTVRGPGPILLIITMCVLYVTLL